LRECRRGGETESQKATVPQRRYAYCPDAALMMVTFIQLPSQRWKFELAGLFSIEPQFLTEIVESF